MFGTPSGVYRRRQQPNDHGLPTRDSHLSGTAHAPQLRPRAAPSTGKNRYCSAGSPFHYGGVPMAADFFLGESLVGDGNEVAHIDLLIGSKSGPAGVAFCNALTNNKDGFTTL